MVCSGPNRPAPAAKEFYGETAGPVLSIACGYFQQLTDFFNKLTRNCALECVLSDVLHSDDLWGHPVAPTRSKGVSVRLPGHSRRAPLRQLQGEIRMRATCFQQLTDSRTENKGLAAVALPAVVPSFIARRYRLVFGVLRINFETEPPPGDRVLYTSHVIL